LTYFGEQIGEHPLDNLKYLSAQKVKDAQVLFRHGRNNGAIYLMGYALEFSLKRKIIQTFGFAQGFPEKRSELATLSSDEFVGITADSPGQPMPLKAFHCQAQLDHESPPSGSPLPAKKVSKEVVEQTFRRIQEEVKLLVDARLEEMRQTPDLARLILNPNVGARRKKQNKL